MKFHATFVLAAALLVTPVAANAHHHARHQRHHLKNPSAQDRARFDHSGTRGRMGLGANPRRPEGPGNFSPR